MLVRSYRTVSPLPPRGWRSVLCGTFPRVASDCRWQSPCSVKSGLSSNPSRDWDPRPPGQLVRADHRTLIGMPQVPPARYLLRAKDLVDARYADPITVDDLAAAAGLSRAHFSRMFTRTFGESPRSYLQTRRLERAAALLRYTDRSVADIAVMVGLRNVVPMLKIASAHLWVHDQDVALKYWTEKVGMEVRQDVSLPELPLRWLTV